MISELKKSIDLLSVAESAGVDLHKRGCRHCGLCPFHTEKTPSFFIFPDNRFKCFGCGESGDCIDFVMKLHGLSFPDALKHLGIEQGPMTPEIRRNIERRKQQAARIKRFRDWEQRYCWYVSDLWFQTKRLMANGIPPGDLELYAPLFHMLPIWRNQIDVLVHGTDQEKFKLFEDVMI
jgi:hypothetical protein